MNKHRSARQAGIVDEIVALREELAEVLVWCVRCHDTEILHILREIKERQEKRALVK